MDLKELENGVDPALHWYYRSKYLPVKRYFKKLIKEGGLPPSTIIDFGSGSGFFAIQLRNDFPDLIGKVYLVDIGYEPDEIEATRGKDIEKTRTVPEGLSNALILMMDVLEHIEFPDQVLDDIQQRLGENVFCFVTVPAFMSVWSTHDVFLGHYRRYTLRTLYGLLQGASVRIDKGYYLYFSIFPLVWMLRRIKRNQEDMEQPESSDMKPVSPMLNTLLFHFHSLEMKLTPVNRLFGLSCAVEGKMK